MLVSENKDSLGCSPHTRSRFCDQLTSHELEVLHFILGLSEDYPNIQNWYVHKVIPGLRLGTRYLLPLHRDGELVGVGIAKNEDAERKICTVRVAPHHFGRGLGLKIFDGLLKWLDDDRPCLTVSAAKITAFERIFDWYGFQFTGAEADVYVAGKKELGYNGAILDKAPQRNLSPSENYSRFSIATAKSID